MDEERKIEKLLRAYAKKRRADAGDPLKLHPAMRRQLQAEVRRREGKPDEDESLSLWQLFRQQWMFLVGFALVIFFVATMFLPAISGAKKKAMSANALNNLKEIGVAAQMVAADANGNLPPSLDGFTNQLISPTVLTDPQSGERFIYLAGGKNLDALPGKSVLAYAPEDRNGRAVLLADGTVEYASRERFSQLTNSALLALAKDDYKSPMEVSPNTGLPMADMPAPAGSTIVAQGAAGSANGLIQEKIETLDAVKTKSIQFGSQAAQLAKSQLNALQNSFRNNAVSLSAPAVLANFLVQQTGNAIRVLDADGSVYDGAMMDQAANATPEMPPPSTESAATVRDQSDTTRQLVISGVAEKSAPQNYFFRVAGMNRTLKQNVVFTGNLMMISNNVAYGGGEMLVTNHLIRGQIGGQVQAPTQQLSQNSPQSAIWSNARIAGTAVISVTNIIKIDATSP